MCQLTVRRLAALCFAVAASSTLAQAQLTAVNLTLVSYSRISLTQFQYTYNISAHSGGPAYSGVTAVVTSTSSHTVVVDGYLTFGNVPAGGTVVSTKTFSIRQDRTVAFDPTTLTYTFSSTSTPQ